MIPSFYLGFQLITDSSITRDGIYIDNLELYREPMVINGYGYDYIDGTSMATPFISGVAGLVLAQNPDYSHIQVRNAILHTVDRLPSLIGKVVTEGRINAFRAITYIAPLSNFNCIPRNGSVLLNWEANSESAVTGYIVSCYKNQGLIRRIDVGDVTTFEVSDLPNGTELNFEVHSVAEFPEIGLVKSTSSGVLAATPNGPVSPSPSNPSVIGSTGGGGGGGCFISTTTDKIF